MPDALTNRLADKFAQVAAQTLVGEYGIEGARAHIACLLNDPDDDLRGMYLDIDAALAFLAVKAERRLAS